jgi:DNA-directed RNA polymerase specialized sigma24 family protein
MPIPGPTTPRSAAGSPPATEQALAWSYERYAGQIHGMAVRAFGPGPDAEDVTQQVFVSAWTGRAGYRPAQAPLPAWLVGVCRHKIADTWTRRNRQRRAAEAATSQARSAPAATGPQVDTSVADRVLAARRAVDALAVPELAAPGAAVPPPPDVWAGIAAATGVATAPRPEVVAAAAPAPPAVPPLHPAPVPVAPLRTRRSRLLLAAPASLVVGVGIGAGAVALGTGDGDGGAAVAAAALDPLDDSGATGEARVVERDDGTLVLEVDLPAADPQEGFYEVWLLDEAVEDLVSLGVVRGGGEVALTLPSGLDLGEYPVVDVSVEPLDGDPGHSGVSVARGSLQG